MRYLFALALILGGLSSCGGNSIQAEAPGEVATTSSTAAVFYDMGNGLRCPSDLYEDEIADFASDEPGFESVEAAADVYWGVQPGQTREERSGMSEEIRSDASILYSDSEGNGSLILSFEEYPNGWLQTGFARCVTP